MIKSFQVWWHLWKLGHNITIDKYHTSLAKESGNGWYIKCDCGKRWVK